MFWPDDKSLERQVWWSQAAWDGGPTYGALVAAVRPAFRAALLLGYEVSAVGLGFGKGVALGDEWQMIGLETLELLDGGDLSPDKQAEGPSLWLEASPIFDMGIDLVPDLDLEDEEDELAGSYAVEFDFGLFGSDTYTDDGTVPAAITAAVGAVVERAVQALALMLPSKAEWDQAVEAGGGLPREENGGLMWILDPHYWEGVGIPEDDDAELSPAATEIVPVVEELLEARDDFLRGQLMADRRLHGTWSGPGPANLHFLLGRERWFFAGRAHARFWVALMDALQVRGEAHRLWERERGRFSDLEAPNWLDVLSELLGRGVLRISGLFEPDEPPAPLTSTAPTSDSQELVKQVTLTIWGRHTITLRRVTVFADQPNEGVMGSAAWDYAVGADQVKPTVILVAGRGIAIEHGIDDLDARPWTLEIYRVRTTGSSRGSGPTSTPWRC